MPLPLRSPPSSGSKGLRKVRRQKKKSFLRPTFLAVLVVLILLLSILQFTTTLVHQGVLYQENKWVIFSNKRMAILPQSPLKALQEHRFERKVEETKVISTAATKHDETNANTLDDGARRRLNSTMRQRSKASVTAGKNQRSEVAVASLSTHTKEEDLKKQPQNTTPKLTEKLGKSLEKHVQTVHQGRTVSMEHNPKLETTTTKNERVEQTKPGNDLNLEPTTATKRVEQKVALPNKLRNNREPGSKAEQKPVIDVQPTNTNPQFAIQQLLRTNPEPLPDFLHNTKPMDPLGPHFDISGLRPLNLTLQSKYLGVLLDAGRHYFEVEWIKRMMDVLGVLQYNLIHFRLTDDQTFNVRLDSQPDLAYPVQLYGNNKTYTPNELRELVAYAKQKGIVVVPEINLPGHAGAWAGIPGLIVQCPKFICQKGYGVPLNVTNPKLRPVLTDVIREVLDIFDSPPFLHLGGDEVDLAAPCFQEINQPMFNYTVFEQDILKPILLEIGYPEERVLRWEITGPSRRTLNKKRAGKMDHFWIVTPGDRGKVTQEFFASSGLYMDANEEDTAWKVFLHARKFFHLNYNIRPVGVVAGTFELDSNFWYDRNVIGRLLAVTMGVSDLDLGNDSAQVFRKYDELCRQVGFESHLCRMYGKNILPQIEYKTKWRNVVWKKWKDQICQRLTVQRLDHKFVSPDKRIGMQASQNEFWDIFGTPFVEVADEEETSPLAPLRSNQLVKHRGILMDLTLYSAPLSRNLTILPELHSMGLNQIQLRLSDDIAVAYRSRFLTPELDSSKRHSFSKLKTRLVLPAAKLGITIVPEISLTTNAGGWHELGFNVPCPKVTCEQGRHLPLDVTHKALVPLAYSVIREVLSLSTSRYLHLGSDERYGSMACFNEAGKTPNFSQFEQKLAHLLSFDGISTDRILRWENEEQIVYPGRMGSITQCHSSGGDCRNGTADAPWYATVNLGQGGAWEIFNTTRALSLRKPLGIVADFGGNFMDENYMKANEVLKRLLAFAMGTEGIPNIQGKEEPLEFFETDVFGGTSASDTVQDVWSRERFQKTFVEICQAKFGKSSGCMEFANSDKGIVDESEIRQQQNRERICNERMEDVMTKIFRKEFTESNP